MSSENLDSNVVIESSCKKSIDPTHVDSLIFSQNEDKVESVTDMTYEDAITTRNVSNFDASTLNIASDCISCMIAANKSADLLNHEPFTPSELTETAKVPSVQQNTIKDSENKVKFQQIEDHEIFNASNEEFQILSETTHGKESYVLCKESDAPHNNMTQVYRLSDGLYYLASNDINELLNDAVPSTKRPCIQKSSSIKGTPTVLSNLNSRLVDLRDQSRNLKLLQNLSESGEAQRLDNLIRKWQEACSAVLDALVRSEGNVEALNHHALCKALGFSPTMFGLEDSDEEDSESSYE